jgi:hypothetical protein
MQMGYKMFFEGVKNDPFFVEEFKFNEFQGN